MSAVVTAAAAKYCLDSNAGYMVTSLGVMGDKNELSIGDREKDGGVDYRH